MSTVVIACKTIEQEILTAMADTHCTYNILWLESGLHNWPDKLRQRIQELLDSCIGVETVLLAMGFCGNSVVGLQTHDFQLVIPRCDDCITLLLGSWERRQQFKATYFMTEGWMTGERNIYWEYQQCLKKYGEKRGAQIFSAMLSNYRYIALLDTGCFDREQAKDRVQAIANEMGLEYRCLAGTLTQLHRLLQEHWQSPGFVTVPPHSTVTPEMCKLVPQ